MSNACRHVELLPRDFRRRRWTREEKLTIIEQSFEPGETVSSTARRHGVAPTVSAPTLHSRLDDDGKLVEIKKPSTASSPSSWHNPDAVATFVPDGESPTSLNDVPMTPWRNHPTTLNDWTYVNGVKNDIGEPPFENQTGRAVSSGVVIEEPDGRIWLVAPTNQFGGYEASFPKGRAEVKLSLQANAIKEAFEELGLQVQITGFVGDFERTTSLVRMYFAKRVGGDPTQCGWETQAVHLVPRKLLCAYLNMWSDRSIAENLGAGSVAKDKREYLRVFI